MSRSMDLLAGLLLVVSAAACASTGATTRKSSPDKLTRAEIAMSSATNGYEAISRLRPNWLRAQGTASIAGAVRSQRILLYIDNQRAEDLYALKNLSAGMIESAEWIDATRVATVLSNVPSGSYSGAIVVRTH